MSNKKPIFAKTIQHKAPTAAQTHNALKTVAPNDSKVTKSPNTITMTIRTTPEWRDEFKRYAFENRITISETVKLGLVSLQEENGLPQRKHLTVVKSETPKDPRDQDAGRDLHLDLWGNNNTVNALETLAKIMNCTPSELLKNLLIDKTKELEFEGIDTGLHVK